MAKKQSISGRRDVRSINPQKARKLIREFHVLLKDRDGAQAQNRIKDVELLNHKIEKLGGLDMYQKASINGQSTLRGGDSSKYLVKWLNGQKYARFLEVGCLRVDNYCARSKLFTEHVRIDLNSQNPRILKQDFMTMKPEKFDVISLSLVVNYVPNARERGQMLKRAHSFLNTDGMLFFVLPRACTDNSRYTNDKIIQQVFRSVGFEQLETTKTTKLVYFLLKKSKGTDESVPKKVQKEGSSLNNFCIIL